jgi:hypothetical protein
VQAAGRAKDGSIVVFIRAQRFPTPAEGTLEAVQALVTDAIETALNQVGGMSSPDAQCVAFLRTLCLAAGIADRPMCSLALSSERQTERQKGRKTERQIQ